MKKFIASVFQYKAWTCLSYTASVLLYGMFSLIFGKHVMEVSMLFQLAVICAIVTLLQYVCFSGKVIKKLPYSLRMVIFAIIALLFFSAAATLFQWFPTGEISAWILFACFFLLAFFGISIAFEIYFRMTGKRYDGLLGEYKQNRVASDEKASGK